MQYPGNPPQSHRWAINPAALRIVAGLNLGDTVRIAMADMQAVFDKVERYYVHNNFLEGAYSRHPTIYEENLDLPNLILKVWIVWKHKIDFKQVSGRR